MGITWKAMPLLSTLAALVIIVHSAEEDLDRGVEREYRYDLRPRLLDTGTPHYEEPWRAVEAEPMMQKSTQGDIWEDSPERPLKRRKPVRKRKRRPITSSVENQEEPHSTDHRSEALNIDTPDVIRLYPEASEDKHIVQRYHETDEPLRYRDTQYSPEPTTEMPRRRRKRPETRRNRWTEEYLDIDRPLRRRTQRRKRPLVENAPRLTEFGDFRPGDDGPRLPAYMHDEPINFEGGEIQDNGDTQRNKANTQDSYHNHARIEMFKNEHVDKGVFRVSQVNDRPVKEDQSLSEFSDEEGSFGEIKPKNKQQESQNIQDFRIKLLENGATSKASKLLDKIRGDRPIDPVTLKEILKRSNGTSLSEILQQHNLSLSDLLRGKEDLMSTTKNVEPLEKVTENPSIEESTQNLNGQEDAEEVNQEEKEVITIAEAVSENNESIAVTKSNTDKPSDLELKITGTDIKQQQNSKVQETTPRAATNPRTLGIRRKLRIRPLINGTYKSQLNRDLMAQTARKYHNNRNITKSKEWKYVIPMMNSPHSSEEISNYNEAINVTLLTTTSIPEETTVIQNSDYDNPSTIMINTQTENEDEDVEKETTIFLSTTQETTTVEITTTEKPKMSRSRPVANRMGMRRQAFNNRLKRKRMKQKSSTTQPPVERDDNEIDLFGMPNLVSSSEFIARTQTPQPKHTDNNQEDFTTLDDFMTTERSKHAESGPRFTRNSSVTHGEFVPINTVTTTRFVSSTEETAKFEIEEILNDTRTSARLSRILMERNMTLNELVEHRERGSSHVHLADIFHNASKEPNPPEPFLTKSSIEPISKETYPLRAILEANLHDAGTKATTDPMFTETYASNIPVVMDFGNNVNENGENMGIMSLFNKFTETDISGVEKSTIGKDSEGTPYVTTVITVNNTNTNDTTARESRVLKEEDNNLKNDVVAWSELFELMRKSHQNDSEELPVLSKGAPLNHQIMLQDSDGDGLIVLEDLQRLKNLDVNTDGRLDINSYEADAAVPGILDRAPSHTRSVTVATASIVGLAMILFLLTYAAFKWRQQRNLLRKKQNFPNDDRIPTPVFENRKGHKNNLSTRSISPMLATSNIYTLNTLDSNGKDSPDYMWDSLRKPFQ